MSISIWFKFISKEPLLCSSPDYSEKVLSVLSRAFGSMGVADKTILVSTFSILKCIPTNKGMSIPSDVYFKTVTLFSDCISLVF